MKNIIFILVVSLFGFLACNSDDTIILPTNNVSGNLLLKVDRVNAPESVVLIEASLTRTGFDSLTSYLNLISDSTADILLENVAAGTWYLEVDAKDSLNQILYSGDIEVTVLAGFTTQVYLVLEPTGQGTGSIYIYVTWGTGFSSWHDYKSNPVFSPSGNYWDYSGVQQPKLLLIDGTYRMYYTSQGDAYSGYINLAYSSDGINWTPDQSNPILSPGFYGTWDAHAVSAATVIKDETGYKMFYHGWSDLYSSGEWHIGLATSSDGINWVKHPTPVLYASNGWEYQLGPSSVIKIDGVYYLYYLGRNLPETKIGLATSTDGINWTRNPSNPILVANESWEGTGVYYANVHKENNQFIMYFMNAAGTGFGKAISNDGVNWNKDPENPFFTKEDTHNNWADYKIAYPNFIKINNEDRIYYTGISNYNPPSIGFIYK